MIKFNSQLRLRGIPDACSYVIISVLLYMFSLNASATLNCYQWRASARSSLVSSWQSSPQAAVDELVSSCLASDANKLSCQTTTRCYPNTIGNICFIDNFSGTATLNVQNGYSYFPLYHLTSDWPYGGGAMSWHGLDSKGVADYYTESWGAGIGYRVTPGCNTYISVQPPSQTTCGPWCNGVGHPINPSTGAVYDQLVDVSDSPSSLGVKRFYNSLDGSGRDLSSGWRHSYTRYVKPVSIGIEYRQYVTSPDNSSLYSNEESACNTGFTQIKPRVSTWSNATATYANGSCVISSGSTTIAILPIYYTVPPTPPPSAVVNGYDVMRDDGQRIRFTLNGSTIIGPLGISLKLQQTQTGFTVTDANDNVEQYDTNGKLLSVTSRAGVVQTMSYDSAGRLSGASDSFGHQLILNYDAQGRLTSVTRQ